MSECWIGTEDISFGRRDRVVRAASGDGAMKLAPSAIMSGAQRERVGASRTDGEGHGEVSCLRAQSLVAPRVCQLSGVSLVKLDWSRIFGRSRATSSLRFSARASFRDESNNDSE